eukprot:361917-Chlamydomonas_euryale.AAC.11
MEVIRSATTALCISTSSQLASVVVEQLARPCRAFFEWVRLTCIMLGSGILVLGSLPAFRPRLDVVVGTVEHSGHVSMSSLGTVEHMMHQIGLRTLLRSFRVSATSCMFWRSCCEVQQLDIGPTSIPAITADSIRIACAHEKQRLRWTLWWHRCEASRAKCTRGFCRAIRAQALLLVRLAWLKRCMITSFELARQLSKQQSLAPWCGGGTAHILRGANICSGDASNRATAMSAECYVTSRLPIMARQPASRHRTDATPCFAKPEPHLVHHFNVGDRHACDDRAQCKANYICGQAMHTDLYLYSVMTVAHSHHARTSQKSEPQHSTSSDMVAPHARMPAAKQQPDNKSFSTLLPYTANITGPVRFPRPESRAVVAARLCVYVCARACVRPFVCGISCRSPFDQPTGSDGVDPLIPNLNDCKV